MQWYEGDIAEAVTTSKTRNAIFVVYVEGKDDKSKALTSLVNEGEISRKLQSDTFVAIKIEANSLSHNQFAAIYKNVPAPSIFFIGKDGKTISIIVEPCTVASFSTQLDSIIQTHTGIAPTVSQQNAAAKHSEDFIKSEQLPEEVPEKPADVVYENGVCYKISDTAAASTSEEKKTETVPVQEENKKFIEAEKKEVLETEKKEVVEEKKTEIVEDDKNLSKEEKVQRAKELVEQKREVKKQEEEDKEKQKELERRKLGQDVQKMRRWQQDEELKTFVEERQRAKKEEKAARDRILAEIAQDKADRAARFGTHTTPTTSTAVEQPQRPSTSASSATNTARLQFRMPNGSSHTHEFESCDMLQQVREFVSHNMNLPFRHFTLSTTFPRREFTVEDNFETLRDLELCPNAVILILPGHAGGTVAAVDNGGVMSFVWLMLTPFLSIFGFFRNLIFGQPQNDEPQPKERSKKNEDSSGQHSPKMSAKPKGVEPTVIRRQGNSNIHRLTDRTDSDDDNNTWNGNSTQQM